MEYSFKPVFQMGQHVFLNVSGSEEHLVSNISYNLRSDSIEYQLMDSTGHKGWFSQLDITTESVVK